MIQHSFNCGQSSFDKFKHNLRRSSNQYTLIPLGKYMRSWVECALKSRVHSLFVPLINHADITHVMALFGRKKDIIFINHCNNISSKASVGFDRATQWRNQGVSGWALRPPRRVLGGNFRKIAISIVR